METEPIAEQDALALVEAVFRSIGIDIAMWRERRDPLDAEFVLDDILDAEEIG